MPAQTPLIAFVGLSHLGIISSIAAAFQGFEVTGYDASSQLCKNLNQAQLPVLEPDLPEILTEAKKRIHFTSDPSELSHCDVIVFSKDVPTDQNNRSDLSGLRQLIESIVPYAKKEASLVVLSQVPPGFTKKLATDLNSFLKEKRVNLYYQVETLIFGRAVERALKPERYIIGCADATIPLSPSFAKLLTAGKCPILPMRYESAELAKISINAFLAASLSTTNTLAEICEKVGADWSEIAPTLRLDRRIGPHAYLVPGLGIAGGNIERDLVTINHLAATYGAEAAVTDAYLFHSGYRRDWVLRELYHRVLSHHINPVVAIWGLAYKANTKSVKNSPTLALLNSLRNTSVHLYDPKATLGEGYPNVTQVSSALEACQGANALILMTAWNEFASIEPSAAKEVLRGKIILDPSGIWSQKNINASGLEYFTLGKG